MKKIYNIPQCEITALNLQGSVMDDDFNIGGESGGGTPGGSGGTPANETTFDEEDNFLQQKNLWD